MQSIDRMPRGRRGPAGVQNVEPRSAGRFGKRGDAMRRHKRRDPVTPEAREAVFRRDGYACIAPSLGGSAADCWGRLTIEHVKAELRSSVRAESIPSRMVSLCQGHTEDGRRAGFQWNTNAENRSKVRAYLAVFSPEEEG